MLLAPDGKGLRLSLIDAWNLSYHMPSSRYMPVFGTLKKTTYVHMALGSAEVLQLKALLGMPRRQWARPIFEPAAKILIAIGDLSTIRRFAELDAHAIRKAVIDSLSGSGPENLRESD